MKNGKWKDIKGYEGLYKVSNKGRVKSLKRVVLRKNGSDGSKTNTVKEKILKKFIRGRGYYCVRLSKKGKVKNHLIHRLVAGAFIPNPENKAEVNHKNGIKTDNRVENLEWCTGKQNHKHAAENGLKATGEANGNSKLTKVKVARIRKLYKTGNYSQRELASMFDMSRSPIQSIVNGKTWRHV